MLKKLIFLSVAIAVFGSPKPFPNTKHSRIVGGENADVLDYPWQVSIEFDNAHFCGGTIISEKYIVTAGRCTNWFEEKDFLVAVNTSLTPSRTAKRYKVAKFHHNPDHDVVTHDKDFSIIELATPLELGPGVQPIKLPEGGATPLAVGTPVTVTGWGFGRQLKSVEVNIVGRDECALDYKPFGHLKITENMVCAGVAEGGKDACAGDYGGAIVADGIAYGVFSWGYGDQALFGQDCGTEGFPSIYVDLIALRSFITEITGL